MQLVFLEDSNTLAMMLPEGDVQATLTVLQTCGVAARTDLPPEQIAAVDSAKLSHLPADKREALAAKRTAQHFRRLALQCPLRSMQKFLCEEITRLGQQAPSRREREAAERSRRAKQAEKQAAETPNEDGWTLVQRRKKKAAKKKAKKAAKRNAQRPPQQQRTPAATPEQPPVRPQTPTSPRDTPIIGRVDDDLLDLDADDDEVWPRTSYEPASGSGWASDDYETEEDPEDREARLNQDLLNELEMAAETTDEPTKEDHIDAHMLGSVVRRDPLGEDVATQPAAKKTRATSTSPSPAN
jgi:hypothetical protein